MDKSKIPKIVKKVTNFVSDESGDAGTDTFTATHSHYIDTAEGH